MQQYINQGLNFHLFAVLSSPQMSYFNRSSHRIQLFKISPQQPFASLNNFLLLFLSVLPPPPVQTLTYKRSEQVTTVSRPPRPALSSWSTAHCPSEEECEGDSVLVCRPHTARVGPAGCTDASAPLLLPANQEANRRNPRGLGG